MTNYEKIINMSIEEMVEFLTEERQYCAESEFCVSDCETHAKLWLNSEVKE